MKRYKLKDIWHQEANSDWVRWEDYEQLERSRDGWKADAKRQMANSAFHRDRYIRVVPNLQALLEKATDALRKIEQDGVTVEVPEPHPSTTAREALRDLEQPAEDLQSVLNTFSDLAADRQPPKELF